MNNGQNKLMRNNYNSSSKKIQQIIINGKTSLYSVSKQNAFLFMVFTILSIQMKMLQL